MRRLLLLLLLVMPIAIHSQTYDELWIRVDSLSKKDMPRDELNVLKVISDKAMREKQYGQMVAAERINYAIKRQLAPDSLPAMHKRVESLAQQYAMSNPVLSAVYYCVIEKADSALANKDLLANTRDADYSPLVSVGVSSDIFNHDLLHVIGMYLHRYDELSQYYKTHGNRRAALIMACLSTNKTESLDSLVNEYSDLDEKVYVMGRRAKLTRKPSDEWQYVNKAIDENSGNQYLNILQNEHTRMQQPRFNASLSRALLNSSDSISVKIEDYVNTDTILFGIRKVGTEKPFREYNYAIDNSSLYEPRDTILLLPPLPLGNYEVLVGINGSVTPQQSLPLKVSDLSVVVTEQPNMKYRVVTLDSYSGHPHASAKVMRSFNRKDCDGQWTSDSRGEVVIDKDRGQGYPAFKAFTDADTLSTFVYPEYFSSSSKRDVDADVQIITDRSVYRPGQVVHVAAIAFYQKKNKKDVISHLPLAFTITNEDDDDVDTIVANTDDYGTATVDFKIPKHVMPGQWTINVSSDIDDEGNEVLESIDENFEIDQNVNIRVEEYKRPTFYVTIDKPSEAYLSGDTLRLKGKAVSYSGIPIKNAKVVLLVKLTDWFYDDLEHDKLKKDTITTNNSGEFTVNVPIIMPSETSTYAEYRDYYRARVNAVVTDISGESQQTTTFIPISRHKTKLDIDLVDKQTTDKLLARFKLTNLVDKPVDGTIHYSIDDKTYSLTAQSNDTITIDLLSKGLSSGIHKLYAVYDGDTVTEEFTFINFDSKRLKQPKPIFLAAERLAFKDEKDCIRVQMGTSLHDVYVLYNVYSDSKVIESRREVWNDELITRTFKYKPSYGAGLLVDIAFVKDGCLYERKIFLSKPAKLDSLDIKWTTFRDRLTPGQTETWTLSIKKSNGKPANAQMAATLYDASLDRISPYSLFNSPLFATRNTYIQAGWRINQPSARDQYRTASVTRSMNILPERSLKFSHFASSILSGYIGKNTIKSFYKHQKDIPSNTISGRIVDTQGVGIIGATVIDKSSGSHVISDLDGMFSLSATGTSLLEVSYIGYLTQYVTANPGEYVQITMQEDEQGLDEVVVVGYGILKKDGLSGNVLGVNAKSSMTSMDKTGPVTPPVIRTYFTETALWAPRLLTDKNGNMNITFTLPENLTSWKFLGFAHDCSMNYSLVSAIATASKELMVQPNIPRFVRRGDKATITTRIDNLSKSEKKGYAKLEIVNPETDSIVYETLKPFAVTEDSTIAIAFDVEVSKESCLYASLSGLPICRITAVCDDGSSDGEQHYLPILPDRVPVLNTVAASLNSSKRLTVNVDSLFGKHAANRLLSVTYTKNPEWHVVAALATLMQTDGNSSVDIMSNLYSTCLAKDIIDTDDKIDSALESWMKADTASALLPWQNEERLRTIIDDEMPWAAARQNRTEFYERLSELLNDDALEDKTDKLKERLSELQNTDGSFSWFKGMPGNLYITNAVTQPLVKLQRLTGMKIMQKEIDKATHYLYRQLAKRLDEQKKIAKNHRRNNISKVQLNFTDTDYQLLYTLFLAGYNDTLHLADDIIADAIASPDNLTIYGKAVMAQVLAHHGHQKEAHEFLQSIRQYSVRTPAMGIYFDTDKAEYTWRNYKLPTVAAAISAFAELEPADTVMVNGMRQWLLESKRTQLWDTQLNSVNAIYAFLNPSISEDGTDCSRAFVDGKPDEGNSGNRNAINEALGAEQWQYDSDFPHTMAFENCGKGTQWVTVYAQSLTPLDSTTGNSGQGFTVQREIIPSGKLHIGDKVTIRITIHAERDFDCVAVSDNHAACLEPTDQLSGYNWWNGYYTASHDTRTDYFFGKMSKGEHIIERSYFIDRAGEYTSGLCTVQCSFSPEFTAKSLFNTPIVAE